MEKEFKVKLLYSGADKSVYFKMSFGNEPDDIRLMQALVQKGKGRIKPDTANNGWCQIKLSTVPRKDEKGNSISSPFEGFFEAKAYQQFLGFANKHGYPCAKNTEDMLESSKNAIIKQRNALSNVGKINDATDDLVQDILQSIENGYDDPQIAKIIHSIKSADIDDANEEILKTKEMSANNKLKIYAQWRMHGKQGMPTDVATITQWMTLNRYVNSDATPLVVVRTSDSGSGMNKKNRGIDRNQMNGANANYAYTRSDKFTGGNGQFYNYVVYDVSDTTPMSDDYEKDINYKGISGEFTDGDQPLSQQDLPSPANQNESDAEKNIRQNLLSYCQQSQGLGDVAAALQRNIPFHDVLKDYFLHVDVVDRARGQEQQDKLQLLIGAALIKLNIESDYGKALVRNVREGGRIVKYGIPDVISALNDFLTIIGNVNESRNMMNEGLVTADWLLGLLGMTVDEYKQKHQEAIQSENTIKESFRKTWNKLIDANSRNHAVI